MQNNVTWFLLFDGESEDGRGCGRYAGRTTDPVVAQAHYQKCAANPYSVGRVSIVTDHELRTASDQTIWSTY